MEIVRFILLVVIGGLIGWLTNKVAIKMLFRPINPHKFLGLTFQGVFPRRKDEIAVSLADIIETELLSKDVLMDQLLDEEKLDIIKDRLKTVIVEKLSEAIPSVLSMMLGGDVKGFVRKYIDKHGDEIFNQLIDEFRDAGLENINIREIVKNRIDELDFVEFEKIIFGLMNKELRFVEIIGLFLGAIIGVIQYLVTILI
ncbi:MAG: DUF445 family protein [Candidatus Izemoplasmatales bacterium]|nr:DUF445 family protein [Candidatus Izemoplasmatales bacterium]MDD4070643.1 DUF445 family protein [Candidatus Izemoplasmatales bacterium]